jgi:hypothetical protein
MAPINNTAQEKLADPRWLPLAKRLRVPALVAGVTGILAWISIRSILALTGGEPAVPLDDSYIHFQYARAWAELHPFAYSGGAKAPGATSLLWPVVLAPFWAIGFNGSALAWIAWLFGFTALGLTAVETFRLARGLVEPAIAVCAGAMVLTFGGLVWCAGSGMEVVPFAWLLTRSARVAAQLENPDAMTPRLRLELVILGIVTPLVRPEGILATCFVIAALLRGRQRVWAVLPIVGPLIVPIINLLSTGQAASTTAQVKWLPSSPYYAGARLWQAILGNVELLFGTLLDGEQWAALFVPAGSRYLTWVALPALAIVAYKRRAGFRGGLALALALGILIPTSYDSFLWNRLRYLWPFAPGWFVALAALGQGLGDAAARWREDFRALGLLVSGGVVGALAGQLSRSIDDLAVSSDAIRQQQVSLGRWAKDALPPGAVIGVNDTGAVAYFSGRPVFDVVGLTTRGEARYWVGGAGSRFEHYERMDRSALPTHFIVYREWMAIDPLLGEELTSRFVNATILGGTTMSAHVADYSTLGSAELPLHDFGKPIDRVDVADLESEAAHGYELFWATQQDCVVFESIGTEIRADGGRKQRSLDRFQMELVEKGSFAARLSGEAFLTVQVHVDGRHVGPVVLLGKSWDEVSVTLPAGLAPGRHRVELSAPEGKSFAALSYWSFPPQKPASARRP